MSDSTYEPVLFWQQGVVRLDHAAEDINRAAEHGLQFQCFIGEKFTQGDPKYGRYGQYYCIRVLYLWRRCDPADPQWLAPPTDWMP